MDGTIAMDSWTSYGGMASSDADDEAEDDEDEGYVDQPPSNSSSSPEAFPCLHGFPTYYRHCAIGRHVHTAHGSALLRSHSWDETWKSTVVKEVADKACSLKMAGMRCPFCSSNGYRLRTKTFDEPPRVNYSMVRSISEQLKQEPKDIDKCHTVKTGNGFIVKPVPRMGISATERGELFLTGRAEHQEKLPPPGTAPVTMARDGFSIRRDADAVFRSLAADVSPPRGDFAGRSEDPRQDTLRSDTESLLQMYLQNLQEEAMLLDIIDECTPTDGLCGSPPLLNSRELSPSITEEIERYTSGSTLSLTPPATGCFTKTTSLAYDWPISTPVGYSMRSSPISAISDDFQTSCIIAADCGPDDHHELPMIYDVRRSPQMTPSPNAHGFQSSPRFHGFKASLATDSFDISPVTDGFKTSLVTDEFKTSPVNAGILTSSLQSLDLPAIDLAQKASPEFEDFHQRSSVANGSLTSHPDVLQHKYSTDEAPKSPVTLPSTMGSRDHRGFGQLMDELKYVMSKGRYPTRQVNTSLPVLHRPKASHGVHGGYQTSSALAEDSHRADGRTDEAVKPLNDGLDKSHPLMDGFKKPQRVTDNFKKSLPVVNGLVASPSRYVTDCSKASPSVTDCIKASPSVTDCIKASPSVTDCIKASPSVTDCIKASSSMADCIKASPSMTDCIKASPSVTDCVKASPSVTDCSKASPSMTDCIKASSSMTDCIKASPSVTDCIKASPSVTDCIKASPSMADYIKASSSMADCIKASPSMTDCIKASPSMADCIKASPSMADCIKASSSMADCIKASMKQAHGFRRPPHLRPINGKASSPDGIIDAADDLSPPTLDSKVHQHFAQVMDELKGAITIKSSPVIQAELANCKPCKRAEGTSIQPIGDVKHQVCAVPKRKRRPRARQTRLKHRNYLSTCHVFRSAQTEEGAIEEDVPGRPLARKYLSCFEIPTLGKHCVPPRYTYNPGAADTWSTTSSSLHDDRHFDVPVVDQRNDSTISPGSSLVILPSQSSVETTGTPSTIRITGPGNVELSMSTTKAVTLFGRSSGDENGVEFSVHLHDGGHGDVSPQGAPLSVGQHASSSCILDDLNNQHDLFSTPGGLLNLSDGPPDTDNSRYCRNKFLKNRAVFMEGNSKMVGSPQPRPAHFNTAGLRCGEALLREVSKMPQGQPNGIRRSISLRNYDGIDRSLDMADHNLVAQHQHSAAYTPIAPAHNFRPETTGEDNAVTDRFLATWPVADAPTTSTQSVSAGGSGHPCPAPPSTEAVAEPSPVRCQVMEAKHLMEEVNNEVNKNGADSSTGCCSTNSQGPAIYNDCIPGSTRDPPITQSVPAECFRVFGQDRESAVDGGGTPATQPEVLSDTGIVKSSENTHSGPSRCSPSAALQSTSNTDTSGAAGREEEPRAQVYITAVAPLLTEPCHVDDEANPGPSKQDTPATSDIFSCTTQLQISALSTAIGWRQTNSSPASPDKTNSSQPQISLCQQAGGSPKFILVDREDIEVSDILSVVHSDVMHVSGDVVSASGSTANGNAFLPLTPEVMTRDHHAEKRDCDVQTDLPAMGDREPTSWILEHEIDMVENDKPRFRPIVSEMSLQEIHYGN